jgi:multidrug efflux pump subunit AcrB
MIRKFLKFAIERPALNHIFFVLLLLMAFFAYWSIPKEIFPPAELDKIAIRGGYPGASADVLDKMAVRSLEDGLKTVDNISDMRSIIQNGSFTILADIKPGSDNQLILSNVKDVLNTVKRDLPADMNDPIAKISIYKFPLLLVAISGDQPTRRLLEAADELKQKLSLIKDLDAIGIRGDADEEVRILINEAKFEAYGIPKLLFYKAVSELSSIYPAGTFKQKGSLIYLSTANGAKNAKNLADTLLNIGGRHVRLGDIAKVEYGLSTPIELSHFNGKANISLNVTKTKKGNAIALSKTIRKNLDEFKKLYPDLNFQVYVDTSVWIRNRINLVTSNIFFGLILVFGAMFLSMNWRIATVVGLGIPTSFFIALLVAEWLGYSMNLLSMLGALVALGMIVDEAIVVAENIYRHMEMGKPPREAAIEGAAEMFPAVLTATATTVFAFLPLLIMSGQMGMFVKILPIMITVLLLSSLFEAFYFLPLHAKELFSLGQRVDHHEPSRLWDGMGALYGSVLHALLRTKYLSLLLILGGIIAASIGMMKITKFELFPKFDGSQIYFTGKVNTDSRLLETEKQVTRLEKQLLGTISSKDVSSTTSIIGLKFNPDQSVDTGEHLFHIFINLHERKAENFFDRFINPYLSLEYDNSDMLRTTDAHGIARHLTETLLPKLQTMLAADGKPVFHELDVFVPQAGIVKNDIEIGLGGAEDSLLFPAIKKLKKAIEDINGTQHVTANAKSGPQELKIRINDYGQSLGFSEAGLVNTLRGTFLEAEYGKLFDQKGLIRLRMENPKKKDGYDISALQMRTPDGKHLVSLGEIVDFVYHKRMLHLYKENGERLWSVSASVDKEVVLPMEAMKQLEPLLGSFRKQGISVIIKGEQKANKQLASEMSQAAIIAIFLIFISLVWMFNSFVQPLIVLTTIPLSVLGALVGTKLFGLNMTMLGVMGMIGLAGVVVNDGLIMIDFIRRADSIGEIIAGAKVRLRPIVLTSVTTVLGLSTIIFFASGQSLIVQPMAISLGFGVAWATVLNLIYVPILYAVIYRVNIDKKTSSKS